MCFFLCFIFGNQPAAVVAFSKQFAEFQAYLFHSCASKPCVTLTALLTLLQMTALPMDSSHCWGTAFLFGPLSYLVALRVCERLSKRKSAEQYRLYFTPF